MITESQIVAGEGYGHLLVSLLLTGVLYFWSPVAAGFGLAGFCFCVYFFRNPTRVAPMGEHLMISPADGKIIFIGKATERHFLNKDMQKISIFMSPLDVHVNRSPFTGVVVNKKYQKGRFAAAFSEKSSSENEQMALHLRADDGQDIVFVQVAGWLARRIVCYPRENQRLKRGEIFGMIKFGSRMDIYFPESFPVAVTMNQRVKAGHSVLAAGKS